MGASEQTQATNHQLVQLIVGHYTDDMVLPLSFKHRNSLGGAGTICSIKSLKPCKLSNQLIIH